ncbi:MAG: UvrD-helicase domain-containing protein [Bacilli bacterium]|nr:UvrD-helicase domain-containing protein [Bacilli bacterium]
MDYSHLLNSAQLAAVSTTSQYTRVIAGAGSGKTRVLTYRIAYLISEMQVDPSKILAIAFTNKVANEMKERVVKLLPDVAQFLHVSTFHSFGVKFLRQEIQHLGFSNSFTIFDDDDTERLIRDICVSHGYQKKDDMIKIATNYIYTKKCKGEYPENVKLSHYYNEKECLEIFKEYEQKKDEMIALDFDDLLLKPIIILENFPEVQAKWQKKLPYILIDEFQDTNDVQFTLVKLLSNPDTSIYVVGDPDQTIYTWRGANQKIILDFEKTYRGAKTIILDRNYRSTKTILEAANKLIANNKKRVEKNLYTENLHGDKIELFKGYTKEVEAQHVVTTIKQLINKKQVSSNREIAILYRSSYLTLPLEKELTKARLRYRVFGGVRFYQRKEIKDALAYFRLILNPKDDVSFDRIINVPRRKIGGKSVEDLKHEAHALHVSYYEYIKDIQNHPETNLSTKVVMALSFLVNEIEGVKKKLSENDEIYSKILEDFLVNIGYFKYLEEDDDGEERLANLKTLFADMFDFIKKNPDDGFSLWLENCTLATSQDDMNDDNYISLMTVHTAKGLEFNHVFVIGLAEGVFPNQRAINDEGRDGLEEERRLAYVAFTRAKEKLYLSMNSGYSFVNESNLVESQFIEEAGLKMPNDPYFSRRENYPRIRKIYHNNNDLFGDFNTGGDEAEFSQVPVIQVEEEHNHVNNWSVGDRVEHEKFGSGVVKKVIDESAIVIDFKAHGLKTMLANHKMLKRVSKIEEMD